MFLPAQVMSSAPGTRLKASMKSSAILLVPAKPHLRGWYTARHHLFSARAKKWESSSSAADTYVGRSTLGKKVSYLVDHVPCKVILIIVAGGSHLTQ